MTAPPFVSLGSRPDITSASRSDVEPGSHSGRERDSDSDPDPDSDPGRETLRLPCDGVPATRGDPPEAAVLGFSRRKRRYLQSFLPRSRLRPVAGVEQLRPGETVVVWASSPEATALSARSDLAILRVEDGFLRSVGLGSRLTQPLSWIIDTRGIYYDPSRPSDVEQLLEQSAFDPTLLARAARLRERIVASRISKYNLGNDNWPGLSSGSRGRRVVLVAGQVTTDTSLQSGAGSVRSNIALLQSARDLHPDHWLVYKPHPDVVAGLRNPGPGDEAAAAYCDEIVTDAPVDRLIDLAEFVHVITSLTGFEAVLRGKRVYCHGLPFYAGWGLTVDIPATLPLARRRTRRLTLDELVAGALLVYPRYISMAGGGLRSAEQALDELIAWRERDDGAPNWWQRFLRPVLHHD